MLKTKLIRGARVTFLSWAVLAVVAGACGGGGSASKDGAVTSDGGGGDGLLPTACMKQLVPKTPGQAYVINDFSAPEGNKVSWGYSGETTFSGYSYVYPEAAITSDMAGGMWHLSGTVGDYSGFALGFSCAVDASMFTGISFSIKGDAGATGRLVMSVGTSPDDVNGAKEAPSWGKCVPKMSQYDGTCQAPRADVSVTGTANTVKIKWADLKMGAPQPSVSPDSLSGIVWTWDWVAGATPFATDITIDDVVFTVD